MDNYLIERFHNLTGNPEDALSDREYLERMTDKFGCVISRDVCALQAAGHTDIDIFTEKEWATFSVSFTKVVSELVTMEALGYGNSH